VTGGIHVRPDRPRPRFRGHELGADVMRRVRNVSTAACSTDKSGQVCHQSAIDAPELLDELAKHAFADLPPRAPFVLAALIKELDENGVANPDLATRALERV
jgi:hypothetical protein